MMTREVALDLDSMPNGVGHPFQTRNGIKLIFATFGAGTARPQSAHYDAGFDVVYVYATRLSACQFP
jgi:dimethylamine/trimethylamine dehydrogenase